MKTLTAILSGLALAALLCSCEDSSQSNTTIVNGSGTLAIHNGDGTTTVVPVPVETTNAARRF